MILRVFAQESFGFNLKATNLRCVDCFFFHSFCPRLTCTFLAIQAQIKHFVYKCTHLYTVNLICAGIKRLGTGQQSLQTSQQQPEQGLIHIQALQARFVQENFLFSFYLTLCFFFPFWVLFFAWQFCAIGDDFEKEARDRYIHFILCERVLRCVHFTITILHCKRAAEGLYSGLYFHGIVLFFSRDCTDFVLACTVPSAESCLKTAGSRPSAR